MSKSEWVDAATRVINGLIDERDRANSALAKTLARAEKAEAARDEWKRRRDNAVETCRELHDAVAAIKAQAWDEGREAVNEHAESVMEWDADGGDDSGRNRPFLDNPYEEEGWQERIGRQAAESLAALPDSARPHRTRPTYPDPDPYSWGDESVARSLAEGLGYADVNEVRS